MSASNGGTPDMATGPTGSCAASARRGGARAARSKEARMTIDFRPTLAYPRLHQWPPTFGGPFLLEPCKRFRDNRDEAYLSTEQPRARRSEEHTSELQALMRNSYAVFCLKKKNKSKSTTR